MMCNFLADLINIYFKKPTLTKNQQVQTNTTFHFIKCGQNYYTNIESVDKRCYQTQTDTRVTVRSVNKPFIYQLWRLALDSDSVLLYVLKN